MSVEKADLDYGSLPFGYQKTDINVRYRWKDGQWDAGTETDSEYLPLHIAASGLHYGQSVFEGLKIYETKDGRALSFRIEDNAKRIQHSAKTLSMQAPPVELFVEAVHRVVRANQRFLPPHGQGAALYIRPLLVGGGARVGVAPADEYHFIVFATPVGPYFRNGFSPTKLIVESDFERASPGGVGTAKAGGNYAAGMRATVSARAKGFGEALYLDVHKQHIDELGAANFFGILEGSESSQPIYVTPDSPSVLKSITNDSLMKLAADIGYKVEKRPVHIDELLTFTETGACGTAAIITPVESITHQSEEIVYCKDGQPGPHCTKLYNALTAIQYGDSPDPYGWTKEIKFD